MIDISGAAALDPLQERLCLDFANTADEHPSQPGDDFLTSYPRLVEWSVFANVLTERQGEHLLALTAGHPAEAEAALHYAVAVRESIFRVLAAAAESREPEAADLAAFNHILGKAMTYLRLNPAPGSFGWAWALQADDLEQMLWPVTWSAAELLHSHDLRHLRRCAAAECDWLFMDTSKNHSRRWCSMKDCGNRAKARAHYQRAHKTV